MRSRRTMIVSFMVAVSAWSLAIAASAQRPAGLPGPREPFGNTGEAIYPAFEGWGATQDGTSYLIVLGYMNRNRGRVVEIPIGPNNRIEPGGPDQGQPTVFEPGRQTTVFAIKVPKDFGDRKLTWTLVANGQPAVVTFHLHPDYNMSFYKEESNGNEPPQMKFGLNEPMMSGPAAGFARTLTGTVGQPVPLKLWASDAPPTEQNWETVVSTRNRPKPQPTPRDQLAIVNGQVIGGRGGAGRRPDTAATPPDMTVIWQKMRGPGAVTVTPVRVPLITNGNGSTVVEANATATFSAPGEYVLRAEPVEIDDGFDGLCCFTFANVKVVVN